MRWHLFMIEKKSAAFVRQRGFLTEFLKNVAIPRRLFHPLLNKGQFSPQKCHNNLGKMNPPCLITAALLACVASSSSPSTAPPNSEQRIFAATVDLGLFLNRFLCLVIPQLCALKNTRAFSSAPLGCSCLVPWNFVSAWLIIARFQFQGFSSPGRGNGAKAKMW